MNNDLSQQLQQQVEQAHVKSNALRIVGSNSKAFYGNINTTLATAETLSLSEHEGVINYEPTELVITARAGTRLADIEKLLAENGQMLAFEPPAFSDHATIGGTIACNLSGPRRAYAGAARDFLLGCKLLNGRGEILHFGGEVMKNVAGYDVSRLMAGAMGTLGILLEVSLKVLPIDELVSTQVFECTPDDALAKIHQWAQTPLPVSASSYHDSHLHIRLSGASKAVQAAVQSIGGEPQKHNIYWQRLKEQQLSFFNDAHSLWRLSLASDTTSSLLANNDQDNILLEWGGALRWLKTENADESTASKIRNDITRLDGHATLFRSTDNTIQRFHPLSAGLQRVHSNIKKAFDPNNILNPGLYYADL